MLKPEANESMRLTACDMQSCNLESTLGKIPSDAWLLTALSTIGISLILKLNGRKDDSSFVGEWAAPILLLGVYAKLVHMQQINIALLADRS